MKKLFLLLFIPLVFSCSGSDEVSKTSEIKGQYILQDVSCYCVTSTIMILLKINFGFSLNKIC